MNSEFRKKILFVGIPDMAYACLDGLVSAGFNIIGVVGPKKTHPTFNSFKKFTLARSLNYIEFDNLNDADFIERLKSLNADLAVVCSFNYKIPKEMLETTKDGFINTHPSLLPDYKGANPYAAVIINNEPESGITLHFMDEQFDTGDIIAQSKIQISRFETMGTIFNRTNYLAIDMLIELLKKYETNPIRGGKQPVATRKNAPVMVEKKLFIDFSKSAEEIERFIRAVNPFLLARTHFRQNLTKIISAEIIDECYDAKPGTIVKIEDNKMFLQTGCGLVVPTTLQFGSFFAGTAKDFITILAPKVGEIFE